MLVLLIGEGVPVTVPFSGEGTPVILLWSRSINASDKQNHQTISHFINLLKKKRDYLNVLNKQETCIKKRKKLEFASFLNFIWFYHREDKEEEEEK